MLYVPDDDLTGPEKSADWKWLAALAPLMARQGGKYAQRKLTTRALQFGEQALGSRLFNLAPKSTELPTADFLNRRAIVAGMGRAFLPSSLVQPTNPVKDLANAGAKAYTSAARSANAVSDAPGDVLGGWSDLKQILARRPAAITSRGQVRPAQLSVPFPEKRAFPVSNASVRTIHKTIVLRALHEKSAASRQRVKLARHAFNLQALQAELARYDVARLQKSAADNSGKAERLKYAALQIQCQIEKQALLGGLMRGIGTGLGYGGKALGGLGTFAKNLGTYTDVGFDMANHYLRKPFGAARAPGTRGLGSKIVGGVRDGVGYVGDKGYQAAKATVQGIGGMAGSAYAGAKPGLDSAARGAKRRVVRYAKANPGQAAAATFATGAAAIPALRLGGSAAREMGRDVGNYVTGSVPTLGGFGDSTNVAGAAATGFGQGALDSGRNMIDTALQYPQGAMRRAENVGRRGYHVADAMFGQLPQ
jgi:hypothetical protein